jgi:hypothetical protein
MQKSLTGLIRSLLHDVLETCPELVQDILPGYWERVKSTPWQTQSIPGLNDREIRAAFSRMISDPKLYTNHCFCFFIDGLDEYEETRQEDSKTLVDLLTTWTDLAPATVKICVSSREYNVFMNAFANNPRIRLHNLTKSDMTRYVSDKLQHMDDETDRETLVKVIVENAEGIFVWVALVVRRIREQIENGVDMNTLQRDIDSLPRELNSLFEHILNSLVDSDLKIAYQTISMVLKINEYRHSLSLFSYSFLAEHAHDREFALQAGFLRDPISREARDQRMDQARKRLNGCCRGLVETKKEFPSSKRAEETVLITHRSLSEFLSMWIESNRRKKPFIEFDALDAISQLTLAELKARPPGQIINGSKFDRLLEDLVDIRNNSKLDVAPYSFLESLGVAWERHQGVGKFESEGMALWVVNRYLRNTVDLIPRPIPPSEETAGADRGEEADEVLEGKWRKSDQTLRHPVWAAAIAGNYDFVTVRQTAFLRFFVLDF